MKNKEAERRQQNYARIFEVLNRLDEVAFKGYALECYCGLFVTEWSQAARHGLRLSRLQRTGEEKIFGILGARQIRQEAWPTQSFSGKAGADRLDSAKPEKTAHHPPQSRHVGSLPLFSRRESPALGYVSGECPDRLRWDMNLPSFSCPGR